jgi:hypothetical protein
VFTGRKEGYGALPDYWGDRCPPSTPPAPPPHSVHSCPNLSAEIPVNIRDGNSLQSEDSSLQDAALVREGTGVEEVQRSGGLPKLPCIHKASGSYIAEVLGSSLLRDSGHLFSLDRLLPKPSQSILNHHPSSHSLRTDSVLIC